jgi:hypothetical protein
MKDIPASHNDLDLLALPLFCWFLSLFLNGWTDTVRASIIRVLVVVVVHNFLAFPFVAPLGQ